MRSGKMRQKSFRMHACRCGRYANGTSSLFNRTNLTIFVLFLSLLPANDAAPTLKLSTQSPRNDGTSTEPLPTKVTEGRTFKTIDANKMEDEFIPLSIALSTRPSVEHDASHMMPPTLSHGVAIERESVAADATVGRDTIATTLETIPTKVSGKAHTENDRRTDFMVSKSSPGPVGTVTIVGGVVVNRNNVSDTGVSETWSSAATESSLSDLTTSTVSSSKFADEISTENVQRMETVRPMLSDTETSSSLRENGEASTANMLMEIDGSSTMTVPTSTKLKFPLNADDVVNHTDNDATIRTKSPPMAVSASTANTELDEGNRDADETERAIDVHSTTNASIRQSLDVNSSTTDPIESHPIGEIIKSPDVEKVAEKQHEHDLAAGATSFDRTNKNVNNNGDANKEKSKKKLSNENGDTQPTTKQTIDGNFAPHSTTTASSFSASDSVPVAELNQTNGDVILATSLTTTTTEAPTATLSVSETFSNSKVSTSDSRRGASSQPPDDRHNDSWLIGTINSSTATTVNITELDINNNTFSVAPVTPAMGNVDDGKMLRPSNAVDIGRDGGIASDTNKLNVPAKQDNIPSNGVTAMAPTVIDRHTVTTPSSPSSPTASVPKRIGAILDYDKSSEEIFDVELETSTVRTPTVATSTPVPLLPKIKPYEMDSDELFLPADDFDPAEVAVVTATNPSTRSTESPAITAPATGASTTTTQTKESTIERDSDTIFYISNTEVKVVESSVPTPNTKQENQFFPALYEEDVLIDFHSKNNSGWNGVSGAVLNSGNIANGAASNLLPLEKYEEDIILSPMKNNFDPSKINVDDDALNLGYVGESFIDGKDGDDDNASGAIGGGSGDVADAAISSNVIIEPVVIPDVQSQSIGVPIIGELPPQIDLQDLQEYKADTMQLNQTENTITSHLLPHVGDNLQKMQQLSAELPKISGAGSGEAIANIATDATDEKIEVKPIELAQMPFSTKTPSIEPQRKQTDLGLEQQVKNGTQTPGKNATAEAITNVTAYTVLDDEPEQSLTEMQTLVLAGVSTVLPMLAFVVLCYGLGKVYRKVRRIYSGNAVGMNGDCMHGDNSTDPLAINSRTMSADELKSSECDSNGINHSNDNLISSTDMLATSCHDTVGNKINHSGTANGSLITMTMKNNHLIVETEERSDIARDVRETKVHYSPSEKDGVFVVEVARGADSTVGITKPHIPLAVPEDLHPTECQTQLNAHDEQLLAELAQNVCIDDYAVAGSSGSNGHGSKGNEEVLVHQPPNGMYVDDDVLMVDEDGAVSMSSPKLNGNGMSSKALLGSTNTGLSQSDLSLSSSTGSNQGYCYGKQEEYTVDVKGYPSVSPRLNSIDGERTHSHEVNAEPVNREIVEVELTNGNDAVNSKPIITAAIFKSASNPIDIEDSAEMEAEMNEIKEICVGDFAPETIPAPIGFDTITSQKVIPVETIPTNGTSTPKMNGKFHAIDENDVNENAMLLNDESNEFDSLMNLPAPPPTCDEYKLMNDFGPIDNGNMDSLPPPPPEVAAGGPSHCES